MYAVTVTLNINPANGDALERSFATYASHVRAKEPGTLAYYLARSREKLDEYELLEVYRDEAALDVHVKGSEFHKFQLVLRDLLLGTPRVSRLDFVW